MILGSQHLLPQTDMYKIRGENTIIVIQERQLQLSMEDPEDGTGEVSDEEGEEKGFGVKDTETTNGDHSP